MTNFTKNIPVGATITEKNLGYNGTVTAYDANGVMLISWHKWHNESFNDYAWSDENIIIVALPKTEEKTVSTCQTFEEYTLAQIEELQARLLQTVGHNKRARIQEAIDYHVKNLRPYVFLPTKAQKAQKNFTPFLDLVDNVAYLVLGNGSYFRHVLGIYKDHKEAYLKGSVQFVWAVYNLKKD